MMTDHAGHGSSGGSDDHVCCKYEYVIDVIDVLSLSVCLSLSLALSRSLCVCVCVSVCVYV